jgi:hypothetical protein
MKTYSDKMMACTAMGKQKKESIFALFVGFQILEWQQPTL